MPRLARPAALLVPAPPLAFVYLLAIRAERLPPSFVPVVVLALFPLAAVVAAALGRRTALVAIAVVELLGMLLVASMVGFAIAWRSG